MSTRDNLTYMDRESGRLVTEAVYAQSFLSWSYNSRVGLLATELILRHKWLSRFYGWVNSTYWSRRRIGPFVEALNIDLSDLNRPIETFVSFDEFFSREIDLSNRPICPTPGVCVSPVDGRALAYPLIEANTTFRIKRATFDLRELVRDESLAADFDNGSAFVSRLYLADYHHFHFPDSGKPGPAANVPGKYYAVSPYAHRTLVPFYSENHRMVTVFHSDHFGPIGMVEIGAFTIGSIQQRYCPDKHVEKSARKGLFRLGGSTIVLLFEPGAIVFDNDLISNTEKELETYIRLGDAIGRVP